MRIVHLVCLLLSFGSAAAEASAQEPAAPVDDRSVAALAPAAIPAAENAAAHLDALAPLVDKWDVAYEGFSRTPLGMAFEDAVDRDQRPTVEQAAALRELLDRHAELDAALRKAAACTQYASSGDFSKNTERFMDGLLPRVRRFRNVGRFLAFQVKTLSLDGERDEAVRRGVELLRLARLHENEPTLVSFLVRVAVRNVAINELHGVLSAGYVSFDVHTSLDAELAMVDDPTLFADMLRSERAFATATNPEHVGLFGVLDGHVKVGVGEYLDAVIAASEGPWPEFRRELRTNEKFVVPTKFGAMADLLVPGVNASVDAQGRNLAMVRSLRVVNALKLFAKLKKREATGLEELELPAETKSDPFTGKPLLLKRGDGGWTVYSVGKDEKDDGGAAQADYGLGLKAAP